ncbi:MAG: S-layer homology domain-containing protein [Actinomycetota bacterium]
MHRSMINCGAIAALLLTLVTATGARAFEPGRPFDRVSKASASSSWAYSAIRRLERAGFSTGSPSGTFDGARELTRYEFASAVERIYRSIQPRVLDAMEAGALREPLYSFRRLLNEFAPDIGALGHDVAEMKVQVEALEQRLTRLERSGPAALPRLSGQDLGASLRSRGLGMAPGLTAAGLHDPFGLTSLPDFLKSTPIPDLRPGIAAQVGNARIGFKVDNSNGARLPLENPADRLGFEAQLSLPLGSYWLSAFYERETALADRYGLGNPYFQFGAATGLGGAVSGNLSDRLNFRLETASFQSMDDLQRLIYLKGGLRYAIGSRYSLDLGYERSRQFGLPGSMRDGIAYTMGVGRSFGRNASLNLLYRIYGAEADGSGSAGNRERDSSAVTQLTVKF